MKQINITTLVLLPKKDNPTSIKDYRPLACCSVLYKIISKILASWLGRVLPDLVFESQGAFISHRSMKHNIHLCQELMNHYSRTYVSPRCTIKADLQKAYDSIEWGFIIDMLQKLNFPTLFIEWVELCIGTTGFSVQFNGSLHGFFPGKRGLRQGDPMSPLLFVICMEYFSRACKWEVVQKSFLFHPRCRKLGITHLCFADDVMVFCQGSVRAVEVVKKVLHHFYEVSGLRVNESKSEFYSAGVNEEGIAQLKGALNMEEGTLPVRYLGVPLQSWSLTVAVYQTLVSKLTMKILLGRIGN